MKDLFYLRKVRHDISLFEWSNDIIIIARYFTKFSRLIGEI